MAGTVDQGTDTYCLDSLKPGRLVSGKMLVAQRCYRRLTTVRGSLRGGEDEANFGLDIAGFVGRTEDRDLPSMLPVAVKNELLKDPAVSAVDVVAVREANGGEVSWTLTITITCTSGDVELIVSVNDVTAALLKVG